MDLEMKTEKPSQENSAIRASSKTLSDSLTVTVE